MTRDGAASPGSRDASVAVFGSINVDRMRRVSREEAERLADEHDWFPERGETTPVESPPADFDAETTRLGGKGANQVVAAAHAGAETAMFGAVGADASAFGVRETLRGEGVDASAVQTRGDVTGAAYIWVEPDGENRIAIVAGANDDLDESYVASHVDRVAAADAVLLQNEVPVDAAVALLDALDAAGGERCVVVDPAPAAGAAPLVSHPAVDAVTPNESEFAALADALADFDGAVVKTEGADGVSVELPGTSFHVPSPTVDVVDTTGAGDAFAGYFAAELGAGTGYERAVERAVAAGALACTAEGAMTSPDRDAVSELLSE
ncbi:PfkB family carbohydrate kinase [Halobaculum sp. D14]|uniref:PfkB family carbohydrate kinase n=1 Tax=Halobaculum sp. D14 TaxID=3421642 RepID=UPI003EBCD5BE